MRKKTNTNPDTKDIKYLLRTDPRFAKEYLAASPPEKGDKEFILNQKEHTLLEEARNRKWREMVSGAPDTAELWNFLARAEYRSGGSPRKKVRPTGENKPLEAYGQVATSPKEKARLLTLHFATRGNERTVDPCPETESYLLLPEEDPRNVSPQEVALALSQMNNKSAPGRDKITVPMLVNLPSTHNDIADNFTHIIRGADMPLSMLHVDIITLPKPQKEGLSAYRPISLLPTMSKCLERVIYSRLLKTMDARIQTSNFGFRPRVSCEMMLAKLVVFVGHHHSHGRHVLISSLDIRSAYDTVQHEILIKKMVKYQLPRWFCRWSKKMAITAPSKSKNTQPKTLLR